MSKKESATISRSEAAFRVECYESINKSLDKLDDDLLGFMEFIVRHVCESSERNFYIVYNFVRRLCT